MLIYTLLCFSLTHHMYLVCKFIYTTVPFFIPNSIDNWNMQVVLNCTCVVPPAWKKKKKRGSLNWQSGLVLGRSNNIYITVLNNNKQKTHLPTGANNQAQFTISRCRILAMIAIFGSRVDIELRCQQGEAANINIPSISVYT